MQYLGSKNKISKHLLPIMLKARGDRAWVEPFVGGGNMIDKVGGMRIGNDNHKPLIALLKAVQLGWVPPVDISRELYYSVKSNPNLYRIELVGFVGFLCSFGGKWWGGYASNNRGDNYAGAGSRALVKQAEILGGIDFRAGHYLDFEFPDNSLIYCDPPYEGVTGYNDNFDHPLFWQWCRSKSDLGHLIYVSEYSAPDDFDCIKSIPHQTTLNKNLQESRTEKLFTRCQK